MATRRHPQIANVDELEARTMHTGTKFGSTMKHLAQATSAKNIGCSLYVVEPGRAAFPHHFHCANEEAVYILEGEGTLRLGAESYPVRAGDYIAFPTGAESAHQIRNTSQAQLKYLCFSTAITTDVVLYPDSKKFGVASTTSYEAGRQGQYTFRHIGHQGPPVGYFDGEDVG